MIYRFDERIDRSGTNSVKWDPAIYSKFLGAGGEDFLPLWVADMDFKVPQVVIDRLIKRAKHGIFGYSAPTDAYYEAVKWWQKTRHGWAIERDWITITPGVVPALHFIVQALTDEGDQVIIQQPVYYPFKNAIEKNNRVVVNNPLREENGVYTMDFEDLEQKARNPRAKLLILCNPHNPTGNVWSRDDLRQLGEICLRHHVIVISDEIHYDLILPGNVHTPYAALGGEFAQNAVICTAPSKTFNLAGLQISNIIIPNPEIKKKLDTQMRKSAIGSPNLFGITAAEAAYSEEGAQWLDQLLLYLDKNADFIGEFVRDRLPQARYNKPQGTYLAWVDFRQTGLSHEELERKIKDEAKVLLDGGSWFGPGGEGWLRINFACPLSVLEEAMERIASVLSK
jgi:cystathionine beta-lyase